MIPALEPQETDSPGELSVYSLLKDGLPSEFVVIHSLPWLCAAVRQIDKQYAPTGEIDFLVIHPSMGVLALEVKSGRYRIEGVAFVRQASGASKNPVSQLRRNVHGLSSWLGSDPNLRIRFGYGFVFPDSHFGDAVISPALIDVSVNPPQKIFVDQQQLPNLAERVCEMLGYWRSCGGTHPIGCEKAKRLIDTICPEYDGTPSWGMRVRYDQGVWLRMTRAQSEALVRATDALRFVVTGWPGTGKTLIALEVARQAASAGLNVLFITFNQLLRDSVATELSTTSCNVNTWHSLCEEARKTLQRLTEESDDYWLNFGCVRDLRQAVEAGKMRSYDLLVLDEAQALRSDWVNFLEEWFRGKRVLACCDETQLFKFERDRIGVNELCRVLGAPSYKLSIVLRMPRAVTDRLVSSRSTDYQIFSPRPCDPDALVEKILHVDSEMLQATIEGLLTHGVEAADITVLSRFHNIPMMFSAIIMKAGVRHETVARFRGVESPVVVILGAEEMDDEQLFCAYSRATTLCIVLYDVEGLAWNAEGGGFHQYLLGQAGVRDAVAEARRQSLMSARMARHMSNTISEIETVRIAWSDEWRSWLVELNGCCDSSETWIDYLAFSQRSPVFFWRAAARDEIYRVPAVASLEEHLVMQMLRLRVCEACEEPRPHEGLSAICIFCEGKVETEDDPSPHFLRQLCEYDRTVLSLAKCLISDAARTLPIPLVAVSARLFGEANRRRNTGKSAELPWSGVILYRVALAMIYARLAFAKPGATIDRTELADKFYNDYHSLHAVSRKCWNEKVSHAFATCMNHKKLLAKVCKGVFSPVEDAHMR